MCVSAVRHVVKECEVLRGAVIVSEGMEGTLAERVKHTDALKTDILSEEGLY